MKGLGNKKKQKNSAKVMDGEVDQMVAENIRFAEIIVEPEGQEGEKSVELSVKVVNCFLKGAEIQAFQKDMGVRS